MAGKGTPGARKGALGTVKCVNIRQYQCLDDLRFMNFRLGPRVHHADCPEHGLVYFVPSRWNWRRGVQYEMLRAMCNQFNGWARRSIHRVDKCPYDYLVINCREIRGLLKYSFFDEQPTSPTRIQDNRFFLRTAHSQRVPAPKSFA